MSDAVSLAPESLRDGGKVMAFAAAGVEDGVIRGQGQQIEDGVDERLREVASEKSPPRLDGLRRVAGPTRPSILRLQQINVAAAGHIERMPAGTDKVVSGARQRQTTIANRAEEGDHEGSLP